MNQLNKVIYKVNNNIINGRADELLYRVDNRTALNYNSLRQLGFNTNSIVFQSSGNISVRDRRINKMVFLIHARRSLIYAPSYWR